MTQKYRVSKQIKWVVEELMFKSGSKGCKLLRGKGRAYGKNS